LGKKELAQPFGLKELAHILQGIVQTTKPKRIELMGVINANEDSFFERSRFQGTQAINTIENMIEEGASIIDMDSIAREGLSIYRAIREWLRR